MYVHKVIVTFVAIMMLSFFTGCSKSEMPMDEKTIKEYLNATSEAANNMDSSRSEVERMKDVAREPMEKMGYDFDATLLSALKKYSTLNSPNENIPLTAFISNAVAFVIDTVNNNPEEAVTKGLVLEETKNKLVLYKKYSMLLHKEDVTKQMNLINLIRQCQLENNNICTTENFFNIMVKNGIEHSWNENDPTDTRVSDVQSVLMPILQSHIVKDMNGNILDDIQELNTNVMISDQDYAILQKDLTNPWWIQ